MIFLYHYVSQALRVNHWNPKNVFHDLLLGQFLVWKKIQRPKKFQNLCKKEKRYKNVK